MLKDEKISLRAVEPYDLDLLYKWENDQNHWLVSQVLQPYSKFTLEKYLNSIQDIYSDKQLRMIIMEGEQALGILDLFEYDPVNEKVGIGILIDTDFRKKGHASRAITLACNYCFNKLHLHQVYCNILSNNPESIVLFEKAGFVQNGKLVDWIKEKDSFLDQLTYQKFRD